LVGKLKDGIRLLARGELKAALTIEVDSASKAAALAVEKAGGRLVLGAGGDEASTSAASTDA
jgi:large subunit ribosomal protein L15